MKFQQAVFIRKYSEELCNKLERLGYKKSSWSWCNSGDTICTCANGGIYTRLPQSEYVGEKNWKDDAERIDCGINEQLFLSLAALREDTSKFQLFVIDKSKPGSLCCGNPGDMFEWIIGFEPEAGDMLGAYYHKASVEEICNWFGKGNRLGEYLLP